MNLSGFCAADEPTCAYRAPGAPPPPPPPPPPPASCSGTIVEGYCATPAAAVLSPYAPQILSALYRLAAFLGCHGVCPALPAIGAAAAEWFGIPAQLAIPGVPVAIEAGTLGLLIGKFVQSEVCSSCPGYSGPGAAPP